MRCEDCLQLIEEYFDGETDARASQQVAAHLSACEDCAAALDALSFEQETYARYDRGLEVSPALWARVSAEIARDAAPEPPAERRPFLSRARGRFAAALASLSARPALASSFALVLVGVAAGSLWLAYLKKDLPRDVVANAPRAAAAPTPDGSRLGAGGAPGVESSEVENKAGGPAGARALTPTPVEAGGPAEAAGDRVVESASAAERRQPLKGRTAAQPEDVAVLLAESGAQPDAGVVKITYDAHAEESPDFVKVGGDRLTVAASGARPLDPEEKEIARHVEKAQMLLRSIKNARAERGDTFNVAYEKSLSRRLLSENATLQLDAETRGDKDTKQVLDRIEPYLLDIANMPERATRDDVRSIRERIARKEIIAALQVY